MIESIITNSKSTQIDFEITNQKSSNKSIFNIVISDYDYDNDNDNDSDNDTTKNKIQKEKQKEDEIRPKLRNIDTLIMSGGFMSVYSYLGFLKYILEEKPHFTRKQINTYIASSAGCIMSIMMLLDYSFEEIQYVAYKHKFVDYENFDYINVLDFNTNFGLDTGEKMEYYIKNLISYKIKNPYITFEKLHEITSKTLVICGTNIDKDRQFECFSHITTPKMPVWLAVRISCSFPLLFNIVNYNNCSYVDGGVSSHCPIEAYNDVFNKKIEDNLDTILILVSHKLEHKNGDKKNNKINKNQYNYLSYVFKIVDSFKFKDNHKLLDFKNNVLELFPPSGQSSAMPTGISYKETVSDGDIDTFINHGYDLTKTFFD